MISIANAKLWRGSVARQRWQGGSDGLSAWTVPSARSTRSGRISERRNYSERWISGADSLRTSNISGQSNLLAYIVHCRWVFPFLGTMHERKYYQDIAFCAIHANSFEHALYTVHSITPNNQVQVTSHGRIISNYYTCKRWFTYRHMYLLAGTSTL